MKKYAKVLLGVGMLSALMCSSAFAGGIDNLVVTPTDGGAIDETQDGCVTIIKAGTYDVTSKTPDSDVMGRIRIDSGITESVTLNFMNCVALKTMSEYAIIDAWEYTGDLTLNIEDNVVLTGGSAKKIDDVWISAGIITSGNLTIDGTSGKQLNVSSSYTNKDSSSVISAGIYAKPVDSNKMCDIVVEDIDLFAYGRPATATDTNSAHSVGIWSYGAITTNGANITASGESATTGEDGTTMSAGILALQDINIDDVGRLAASGDDNESTVGSNFVYGMSAGYQATDENAYDIDITNATLNANIEGRTAGMFATGDITLTGVTAKVYEITGILADGAVTMEKCNIETITGCMDGKYGIYGGTNVTIDHSQIDKITGATYGIFAGKDINFDTCNVYIDVTAGGDDAAACAMSGVLASNGTVEITGLWKDTLNNKKYEKATFVKGTTDLFSILRIVGDTGSGYCVIAKIETEADLGFEDDKEEEDKDEGDKDEGDNKDDTSEDDDRRTTYTKPVSHGVTTKKTEGGTTECNKDGANANALVTITATPDAGYQVGKVVVTNADGEEITVIDNGDGTYSYRQPVGGSDVEVTYEGAPVAQPTQFTDVNSEDWYAQAVQIMVENGWMIGMSDDMFGARSTLNRAMMAQIVYNMYADGAQATETANFTDVLAGAWYEQAMNWCAQMEFVQGMGNGTYQPNAPVTLEQFCALLYNMAQVMELDTTLSGDISKMEGSAWASNYISWAIGANLFDGMGEEITDMSAQASRAQAAQLLTNFALL